MLSGPRFLNRRSVSLLVFSLVAALACSEREPTAPGVNQETATQTAETAEVQGVGIVPGPSATGRILNVTPAAGAPSMLIPEARSVPLGTQYSAGVTQTLKQRAVSVPLPTTTVSGIHEETSAAAAPSAPALSRSWLGFSQSTSGGFPPDDGLAVGPNHVVGAVNFRLKIWSKTGGQLASFSLRDWFSAAITVQLSNLFDPKVIYDALADRFVVVALGVNTATNVSRVYVAVTRSSSAAPTSNWCVFEFDLRTQTQGSQWLDYPSIGVNSNAVIISANRFLFGSEANSLGTQVAWVEKAPLYSCNTPNTLLSTVTGAFTMQVAQSYISNSNVTYLINSEGNTGNTLRLWRTTSARNPFRATLTQQAQIPVTAFSVPPDAQQPGSTTRLNTGDDRLLNAVLRSPSGLWTAHTTGCRPAGDAANRACARFYQINPSTSQVVQSNQFASSGLFYFYPAAVADGPGNMVMIFNRSGANEFAGVRYSGRRASDPAGAMQPSASLRAGRGCYIDLDDSGRNRFGDYPALSFDASTNAFWGMAEFVLGQNQSCGPNQWGTQVGQIAQP